jgi:hypothetical protein
VPVEHEEQIVADADENMPTEHKPVTAEEPDEEQKLPGGHAVAAESPTVGQ